MFHRLTRFPLRKIMTLLALLLVAGSAGAASQSTTITDTPPALGPNTHYAGNRVPLLPSPLIKLPARSITPQGWLRHQLILMAEGQTGRLPELSKWCKFEGSSWTDPNGQGQFGWEELPYWLKGYISLGYLLDDERIIDEATRWIDAVITSQRDGYFGPQVNKENHDLWPNMIMLYCLRTHYEATGDASVLELMKRYCKWLTTLPLEHYLPGSWQKVRGGDNLDSIYWLYNQTGEEWLLDLARTNHELTLDWASKISNWHGVNLCECFREPAQYYQQSKDIRYLNATIRNYDTFMGIYGQVPGGMFGADENARKDYIGPRQAAETCSMVEIMHSHEKILAITGQTVWADRCEDVAFNSLPAAMTADLKALHYLTAPNQVQLDRANKSPMIQNKGDMFSYNPHRYRCCQHNVAFGWPYFAERLWMATPGNGLAAPLYAACKVKAKVGDDQDIEIEETTDYPFSDTIDLRLSVGRPVRFPLTLRIPGWCTDASVEINGKALDKKPSAGKWVVLDREWTNSDKVRLTLPMAIRARTWAKNKNSLSVDRGPLTYSLKIGEEYKTYNTPDQWPCYEVFPTTAWNYALAVDPQAPASTITMGATQPVAGQPFTPEAAPITLMAKGRKVPGWQIEENGMVGVLPASPVPADQLAAEEEITLIPMGCARLRISAFPYAPKP